MSIENVGSFNKLLNNYNAKDWSKSADLEISKPLDFKIGDELEISSTEKKQSFSDMLAKSITDVNKLQQDANVAIQKLATGESKNIHETMLAVERADIAFKTMNQIRTKVIDAYREIMRMQL